MKTIAEVPKKEFTPVSLTITFESQKELDDFGSLCNLTCITDNLVMPSYFELEKLGANINNTYELLRKIKKHPSLEGV